MRAMIRLLLVAALGFAGSANARSTATEQQIDAAVSAMRPATQIAGRSYPAQSLTDDCPT